MKTIQELYEFGKTLLRGQSDAAVEARVLLCKSAGIDVERFHADGDKELTRGQERTFLRLVSKRLSGVPLSYLTKKKEFWSLSFEVYPGVLIPRPESELIVEKVMELSTGERGTRKAPSKKIRANKLIADIGTGSGNIAISLARELPDSQIVASDVSKTALRVARMNAQNLGVSNVTFAQGSLFVPLERFEMQGKCDFIVSNPPYVAQKDWETLQPEVKDYEPKRALVAGKTGLEFIWKLVRGAPKYLKRGGYLVFEIGYGQKEDVLRLFDTSNKWRSVRCYEDLSGIPRVVTACV